MWAVDSSVRPDQDAPKSALDDLPAGMSVLEHLTFNVLGLDPGTAYCRTITQSGDGDDRDEESRRQVEREAERAEADTARAARRNASTSRDAAARTARPADRQAKQRPARSVSETAPRDAEVIALPADQVAQVVQNATAERKDHDIAGASTHGRMPAGAVDDTEPWDGTAISDDETKAILVLFDQLQITDRAIRRLLTAELVNRPDVTARNMCRREAQTLIKELTAYTKMDATEAQILLGDIIENHRAVKAVA
jgi:hypothetical protein